MAALNRLLQRPIFTAAEARKVGVHPALLAYYAKLGTIERVSRGVYRNPNVALNVDFQWEDLAIASKGIPEGVVCLTSALAYYGLTEEVPRQHWFAVPHSTTAPRRESCKVVRMRNMTVGKTVEIVGEMKIPFFDRERTIVDAFRYLSLEAAIKALKVSFTSDNQTKPDLRKLRRYAKLLRVPIEPYLLMATT
jgi:predicted transcriptional regulator of viral defense system